MGATRATALRWITNKILYIIDQMREFRPFALVQFEPRSRVLYTKRYLLKKKVHGVVVVVVPPTHSAAAHTNSPF